MRTDERGRRDPYTYRTTGSILTPRNSCQTVTMQLPLALTGPNTRATRKRRKPQGR